MPLPQTTQQEDNTSPITALPTLSEEEVLREKLSEAETEAARLKVDNAKFKEENEVLRERIKAHEENVFSYTLANLDAGAVLIDAGERLSALAATVRRREEKGTFALTIVVKPFKGDALVLTPVLKITEPKEEAPQCIFYASEEGDLSRNDPRQREFGFRE